jgi:hypothetical protein
LLWQKYTICNNIRDPEGRPYTVRYDAVNAMLLNEFLKEHRKVEELTKEFQTRWHAEIWDVQPIGASLES